MNEGVEEARSAIGLPPLKSLERQRKCLKCDTLFPSESAGNRICHSCRGVFIQAGSFELGNTIWDLIPPIKAIENK